MCSINGIFYLDHKRPVEASLLTDMRTVAVHRGPDDNGLYCSHNIGLGFNRLSIIDAAGGHQPMTNDSGTLWIVFNGEIYNFLDLRAQLVQGGHRFRTRSDTEVVLGLWERYGEDCLKQLRGMFAFAIWDDRQKTLFAARDRLGIKPFYYYLDQEMFVFASEIKSLLQIPEVPRDTDTFALADFLRHGYALPPYTMFQGIRSLPAGHSMKVQSTGASMTQYWEIPVESNSTVSEGEALKRLSPLLNETVQMHLVSDVPLGVFLSGGLDSSTVVAIMSRLGRHNIQTFSIAFDSPENEAEYAKEVAAQYRTQHHEVRFAPSDFADALSPVVWHMDEPVADAPSIAVYHLSAFASQNITVALSGEGADEIFGGYPTYRRMLLFDRVNRLPMAAHVGKAFAHWAPDGKIRKYGSMLGRDLESRYRAAVIFSFEEIRRLFPDGPKLEDPYNVRQLLTARSQTLDSLARMSYIDLKTWMPNDLLLKADRLTMAHSLELRVPFLDHRLVEYAMGLPANLKIHGRTSKYLLKRFSQTLLPGKIVHRSKKGFSLPTKRWFRAELATFVRDRLLDPGSPCRDFLSQREVTRVLKAHESCDCSDQIYALLVFDEWYRTFIKPRSRSRTALRPTAEGTHVSPRKSDPEQITR